MTPEDMFNVVKKMSKNLAVKIYSLPREEFLLGTAILL
jgi:hypothetical protein